MTFITVQQASKKWGINLRQVQWLCSSGRVQGAVRFNRAWAIPEEAKKPTDGRFSGKQENDSAPPHSPSPSPMDPQVILQAFEHLPFSMNITDMEGTMIYANEIFFRGTLPGTREKALGVYNVLKEGLVEQWGLKEHIARAFQGEPVCTPQLRFPNKDMQGDKYGKKAAFFSLYNDVYSYPIFDDRGVQLYVVTVLIPVKKLTGRQEVILAKEYIDTHWREPFDSKQLAQSVHMSPTRLTRIFREDAGFTPHEYYLEVKINHLREQLLDPNRSVSEAFEACGMDYNSHYTRFFKTQIGMTPLQFRKLNR